MYLKHYNEYTMSEIQKIIIKFKSNPTSIRFSELEKILIHLGADKVKRKEKGKASHFRFILPLISVSISVHHHDCKAFYKKDTLKKLQSHNLI